MQLEHIKKIELSIETLNNLIRERKGVLSDQKIHFDHGYDPIGIELHELLDLVNSNVLLKSIISQSGRDNGACDALVSLKTNADSLKTKIENEKNDIKQSIDFLESELKIKNEELKIALDSYMKKNEMILNYYVKIGKPNNPNETKYKKEELSQLVLQLVDLIKDKKLKVHLGERNKIFLSSEEIPVKDSVAFLFNLVKDFNVVKDKFGDRDFKGVMCSSNIINIKSTSDIEKLHHKHF